MPSTKTGTAGNVSGSTAARRPVLLATLAGLLVLATGLWLGTRYYDDSRDDWIPLQHGTALAGQRRIVSWVASEFARANAIAIALSPLADVNRRLADSVTARLVDGETLGTWLVGASGSVVAGHGDDLTETERRVAKRVAAGDAHTILGSIDSTHSTLSVIVAAPDGRAIVRRIRGDSTLYALADWGQTTTETAQLAIVAHLGDSVFNVTSLRNPAAPPGAYRRTSANVSPLWRSAITSADSAGWFIDERGVSVLATVLAIPPLPWSFIVQIDESEIMVATRRELKLAAALTVLVLALIFVGLMATSRAGRIRRLRRAVEEEQRFHALVASAMDAIVVTDAESVISYANPAAAELFGSSQGSLIGTRLAQLFSEPAATAVGTIADDVRARGTVRGVQRLGITVGARDRFVEVTGGGGVDAAGAPLLSLFFRDVTQQQQMQEELRQNQQAVFVGRLAAGLAHDFNNALQVVTGNLGFIGIDRLSEEARISLDEITKAADRLAHLTTQLLSFGREQVMRPETVDLVRFFRALDSPLRAELTRGTARPATLTCIYRADVAYADVDPARLKEAVMHVIANARQAMPGGGSVTLTIARESHERIASSRGAWAITITDTGIGMRRDIVDKAREPFFSTRPRAVAQGLGLAIVDGFVAQSGGDLTVESEVGRGTTVTIWLPVSPTGVRE